MILNPDVQRKAQEEIDSVVGEDRLPKISDADNLPYVRSVVAETLRWAPAIPLGEPLDPIEPFSLEITTFRCTSCFVEG